MQDPSSNENTLNQMPKFSASVRPSHHRRAHSEVSFRLPEDLDLSSDPFDGPGGSFEELGSEDDLFSTYMDMEKLGGGGSGVSESDACGEEDGEKGSGGKPRHRHSNSIDSSNLLFNEGSCIEAKKAMAPDKLAELWSIDPKRAKRILANRQSAARSKERKSRYITELERKVQTLQTEATTLSAQLTLYQRDTTGVSHENTELKIRLQAMEQQAQLRDALNGALKQEVEGLKRATGQMSSGADTFSLAIQHVPYNQSAFFAPQSQFGPNTSQNLQMPHSFQKRMPHHRVSDAYHDPLGRFQGLDINNRSSNYHLVKPEASSVSASESSITL